MKVKGVYQQEICDNCIQWLANNEGDHTPEEFERMQKTLEKWAKEKYIPAGLTDQIDSYFSPSRCDLCHALPGNRWKYNFFDIK